MWFWQSCLGRNTRCNSFLLLCIKLPQTRQIETAYISLVYQFLLVRIWASLTCIYRNSGTLCSRSCKAALKVSAWLHSHLEAWMGKSSIPGSFRLLTEFGWRPQCLAGCWLGKESPVLEAAYSSLTCGPPSRKAVQTWQIDFSKPVGVPLSPGTESCVTKCNHKGDVETSSH